jgi:peptidoglycan/LPS O-acetylase OafA/YrhL
VITILLGHWLLVPSRFAELLNAVFATALFGSNIYFWATVDYFSPSADLNPMLNTWSLGVEEQFYILFPIALLILSKIRPSTVLPALLTVIVLSLALSSYLAAMGAYSEANFFLLPTRAWELTAGSLLAVVPRPAVSRDMGVILSGLGLLLILGGVFMLDDTMPFPGYLAVPPVLGTMLVIRYADATKLAGRALRLRSLVGIGLISYSAYLWHQPLLAFVRHATFVEPSRVTVVAIILIVFVVSYLSWRFVEQPFRRQLLRRWPPRGVVAIGVMSLALPATGIFYLNNDAAYTKRYPEDVRAKIAYLGYREMAEYYRQLKTGCFISGTGSWGLIPMMIVSASVRTNQTCFLSATAMQRCWRWRCPKSAICISSRPTRQVVIR